MSDASLERAQLIGINHVALTVGDIDDALEWYGEIFAFDLRGQTDTKAFLDMGEQFLALAQVEQDSGATDEYRHFGLVVDDLATIERRLADLPGERLQTDGFDIRDPWGNRIQLVAYEDVQFLKAKQVLEGMGLHQLSKSPTALDELAEKGMAPEHDDAQETNG